jgi:hypothetical protein
MPAPFIPVLLGGVLFLLWGGSKGGGTSSTSAARAANGFLMRNPLNGVIQVKPDQQPGVLAWLDQYRSAPLPPDSEVLSYGGVKNSLSTLGAGGMKTTEAIGRAAALGQHTLISVAGEPVIWFVPRGAESILCAKFPEDGGRWAMLVEGSPAAAGLPSIPGIPGGGGATQPASTTTPGQSTIDIPGFGKVAVPNIPTTPGQIDIPGFGKVAMPDPNANPAGPMAPTGTAPIPTGGTHTLRPGDIGSRLAQWYAGNALRWRELSATNPELVLVNSDRKSVAQYGGQPFGFLPWNPGDVLVLPPGWDASKGAPPVVRSRRTKGLPEIVKQAGKKGVSA